VRTSGSVGSAVMTLQHGDSSFTDTFVLLEVDGAWRIANKAYHRAACRPLPALLDLCIGQQAQESPLQR
jgi:hypothetical protein